MLARRGASVAIGARLLPWAMILSFSGCSAPRKDPSIRALADRWALAIDRADASAYLDEIASRDFKFRAKLVSSDPTGFIFDAAQEEAAVRAFFRDVRQVSGQVGVESSAGDQAVISMRLELVEAYKKGGRDQLRYRIDARLRLKTAIIGGERRIVSIDEEPPHASMGLPLASFALVKLLQLDSVDVQERTEKPTGDSTVRVESIVDRRSGSKLLEVRYTTVLGRGLDAATPMGGSAEVLDTRGARLGNVEVLDWMAPPLGPGVRSPPGPSSVPARR